MQLFWFISNQVYMFRAMFSPIIRSCNYSFWYCPPMLLLTVFAYWVELIFKSVPPNMLTFKSVPPNTLTFKSVPPNTLTFKSVPPNMLTFKSVPPNKLTFKSVTPNKLTFKSVPPNTQHQPAATSVDDTRSCNYSNMLQIMGEHIVWNIYSWLEINQKSCIFLVINCNYTNDARKLGLQIT